MMELVPLKEETPEKLAPPFQAHKEEAPTSQEERLQDEAYLASTLILDFTTSRTVKNTCLYQSHIVYSTLL